MNKYELTDETIKWYGRTLRRIKALKDFKLVTGEEIHAGDLGGYVESENNLSQEGTAWVCGEAEVYGEAKVYGNAIIASR